MRIAGIIAEYDPFHNGHAAHIAATRRDGGATHVVTVISGSMTQRGEPATFTKFQRTAMALQGGADLVLELPVPWSMASAQRFAEGGVSILHALGCVDLLSFGSECGDIQRLKQLASLQDTEEYARHLHLALEAGLPYAAARQRAARVVAEDDAALLDTPNNTLGLEYLRASTNSGANWETFTLARQGTLHHENSVKSGFASGSLLREMVNNKQVEDIINLVPTTSMKVIKEAIARGLAPADRTKAHTPILMQLRRMGVDDLAQLPYVSEGLENRLYKASRTAVSYDKLIEGVKTRRYPLTRIRRMLWAALLGMEQNTLPNLPLYLRVLGMNARGREILSAAAPTLPLLTRTAQLENMSSQAQHVFRLEATATDLHALLLPNPQPCGNDYTQKLVSL